jgi:hypothetical protein
LPIVSVYAFFDTPPKIVFAFATPGKYRKTFFTKKKKFNGKYVFITFSTRLPASARAAATSFCRNQL